MIEVHVLHAWLLPAARHGRFYDALKMLGGLAAPGFLFMAGLSQALADAALARRGVPPAERRRHALRRGLWLLGVAYGFRLVEFLLGGAFLKLGGVEDLLRVDILNVIAVSLVACALLVPGRPRAVGVPLAAAAAGAVVLATPLVASWAHPPSRVLDYVYASWPRANFHLFNWSAFLFAGAALGSLAGGPRRPLVFLALGAGLVGLGLWANALPPVYAHQDFWHTSPAWFAMRLGACVALSGLLQLVSERAERGLGWLSLLGRESLVGYIASVELTYGVLATPLKRALSFPTTLAGMVAMTAATWAICLAWGRLRTWRRARGAAPVATA